MCDSCTPAKALRVGFNVSKIVYYKKSSLAPELLINGITAAAPSVTAELHNSHWREEKRRRRRRLYDD